MLARTVERGERPPQEVEDYVKAIYGREERRVALTTTTFAAELCVTPLPVSSMLARQREMGLISHIPYSEASLGDRSGPPRNSITPLWTSRDPIPGPMARSCPRPATCWPRSKPTQSGAWCGCGTPQPTGRPAHRVHVAADLNSDVAGRMRVRGDCAANGTSGPTFRAAVR
jgi:hypothetical protein